VPYGVHIENGLSPSQQFSATVLTVITNELVAFNACPEQTENESPQVSLVHLENGH